MLCTFIFIWANRTQVMYQNTWRGSFSKENSSYICLLTTYVNWIEFPHFPSFSMTASSELFFCGENSTTMKNFLRRDSVLLGESFGGDSSLLFAANSSIKTPAKIVSSSSFQNVSKRLPHRGLLDSYSHIVHNQMSCQLDSVTWCSYFTVPLSFFLAKLSLQTHWLPKLYVNDKKISI